MRTSCLLLVLLIATATLQAQDITPPTLDRISPEPDSTVATLIEIEVLFSEEVQGVEAADLLINGVPASVITYGVAGQFIFEFPQPPTGTVVVAWAPNHGITDLAEPPNPFAGGSWTTTLNPSAASFQVRINEFMADNENGIRDEEGNRQDWIELYNAAATPVDLSGWYLTDNAAALRGWQFPAGVQMAPNSYLIVWASGLDRPNIGALHTSFQLAKGGEFLGLVLADGSTIVSSFAPAYPEQQTDASYGRDRLDPNLVGYYATPTPGAANATSGSSGFSSDVVYSRRSGTFETPFELTLTTASTNAVIRYIAVTTAAQGAASTTNVPTTNSPLYTGPIPISTTTQIRARAFEPGLFPSTPMTELYIQLSNNVRNFSSDIPIVVIHNMGGGAVPTATQAGMVMIFNNELDRASLTNDPQVATRMGFHIRGSSTGGQAKSSYRLEYWDEFNQDIDLPFLDMPEESDWVLYGINGFDPGLMHNSIFYWLGRQIGHYSPRTRYVEVFRKIDAGAVGTNDYFGLYLAVEVPKIANDRLDIAELEVENTNSTTITGGYLMKIDRTGAQRNFTPPQIPLQAPQTGVLRSTPAPINYEEPKIRGTPTDPRLLAQINYFENHIRVFLTNLASVNWTNPVTGYAQYIDPDQWVDNLIANIIPFNVDGYRLSGYFYKDRNDRLMQGPLWDCDRCLGTGGTITPQGDNRCFSPRFWRLPANDTGTDNGTDFFGVSNVGVSWFERLFRDPNFWQKFIDRYQALRTNEFTASTILGLVDGFHREITEAQVREQARWGPSGFNWPRSGVQTVQGYTFDFGPADNLGRGRFTNEVAFQKKWLLDRLEFMDTNFLAMPVLTNGTGPVTNGTTITVRAAAKPGTLIYYTLDGTDPRLPGGAISPTALSSAGNLTLTVSGNVRLVARCYNINHSNLVNRATNAAGVVIEVGKPLLNSVWSGPVAATFYTSVPPLRITELMYHPADPPPGVVTNDERFEYVEVRNISGAPLNVNGFRLRGGLDFNFPNVSLAAGEAAVVVRDMAVFQSRYGAGPRILGVYTNDNLANDGDHLVLEGSVREPILDFNYDDDWYPATDGHGFSLQIVNDGAATDTWGLKTSWRASGEAGGTPSAADPGAADIATIYVSEALTHTDPVPADAIELHNPTGNAVNIGGWYLTDDFRTPQKYRIPIGTSIPANGYRVFYQSNSFGTGVNGFALSSHGDEVYVFSADLAGNLTGWSHGYAFGPQADGVTFGSQSTSLGQDRFVARATATLGGANSGPKVGPIVISEINYRPPDFRRAQGPVDNTRDEYIELQNTSGAAVPLFDPLNSGNTWRLRDAVDFEFPPGATVPAGGFVLVVGFDPDDAGLLADFREVNGVVAGTPIYGPWSGKLDNSMDSIELVRPDVPVPPGTPDAGLVSYILVERVEYEDVYPWPEGLPDGLGAALGRVSSSAYGDDPANWRTAPKTPGAPLPSGDVPPAIVTQPANAMGIEGQSATISLTATGSALGYIWTFNGEVFSAPSSPDLTLTGLKLNQAGTYACYVFNSAGAVRSSNAVLHVRQLPRITQQPAGRAIYIKPDARAANLPAGTNVSFTNIATSIEPPISYQWRFNGVDIPGAIGTVYTVMDVQLEEEGDYSCAVTDGVSTVFSVNARLTPLLQPIIVVPPLNQTVVEGSGFSQSVEVTGNPVPFAYSWRRGSIVIATNSGNYRSNFITLNATDAGLILTNNILSSNYQMRLVVYNAANNSPGVLTTWTNTVLADFDRDGIPDVVENQLGLSPSNPADGALDLDSDGMSNRAEYTAGTDPASNLSYLRIDQGPGAATVSVAAVSNRTYTVQFTDNLNSGAWSRLADIVARTNNRVETFTDPTWTTNRFYRVAVPRQP